MKLSHRILHYLTIPSVVGHETPFLNYLHDEASKIGLSSKRHKNLVVIHGNQPHSQYLSAHADRHGLISNGEGELEYAAYITKENMYGKDADYTKNLWEKIKGRFIGEQIYAYNRTSGEAIKTGTIAHGYYCDERENFVFTCDTLKDLQKGVPVAFSVRTQDNDTHMVGQLDNVVSVAAIMDAYTHGYQGTAFFTTREEVGESWKLVIDYLNNHNSSTKNLLVLDTTPFEKEHKYLDTLALRTKDRSAEFNTEKTRKVEELLNDCSIPYFFKDVYIEKKGDTDLGHTELGRIINSSNGDISGTTLQLPTLGYHSNAEKMSLKILDYIQTILKKI